MAYSWATFHREFVAAMGAAVPAVVPNGIFMFREISRISWEVPAGYPYIVLHRPRAPAADWGIANDAFEPQVQVHYIAAETLEQGDDPASAENVTTAALEAIKNGVRAATFPLSQATLLEVSEIDFSGANAVNLILLAKNVPASGGMISFRFTLGETSS